MLLSFNCINERRWNKAKNTKKKNKKSKTNKYFGSTKDSTKESKVYNIHNIIQKFKQILNINYEWIRKKKKKKKEKWRAAK